MANISSINGILGGSGANYDSLMGKASGVHNMGEIVFKKGFFGGFSRINYHIGLFSGLNTVITTAEQNRTTKAAVFKAFLDKYDDVQADRGNILNQDLDTEEGLNAISEYLRGEGKNPYLKEAFEFLLTGDEKDEPLSRDEVKMLDSLLQKGADNNNITENEVGADAATMRDLRTLKKYGNRTDLSSDRSGMGNEEIMAAAKWIQGLKLTNSPNEKISEDEIKPVLATTVNMKHWRTHADDRADIRIGAPLLNAISNNVMAAPKLPEPYKNKQGETVKPEVTRDHINALVNKLIDGLDAKALQASWKLKRQIEDQGVGQSWVSPSLRVRDRIIGNMVGLLEEWYPGQKDVLKDKNVQKLLTKMIKEFRAWEHNKPYDVSAEDDEQVEEAEEQAEGKLGLRSLKEDVLIALRDWSKNDKGPGDLALGYEAVNPKTGKAAEETYLQFIGE